MSTVMKIIAGIAVVSIGTTVALTAALQPQGPPSPAVAGVTDPELLRPATISGTMARQPTMTEALEPIAWPAGSTSSGQHSEGDMIETDDPRFSGVVTLDLYSHIQLGMTRAGTFWGQQRVENEHGAWTGSVTGAGNPLGRMDMYSTLIGHGDYEGLYAIVYYAANGSMPAVVNGVILAGAPPPAS